MYKKMIFSILIVIVSTSCSDKSKYDSDSNHPKNTIKPEKIESSIPEEYYTSVKTVKKRLEEHRRSKNKNYNLLLNILLGTKHSKEFKTIQIERLSLIILLDLEKSYDQLNEIQESLLSKNIMTSEDNRKIKRINHKIKKYQAINNRIIKNLKYFSYTFKVMTDISQIIPKDRDILDIQSDLEEELVSTPFYNQESINCLNKMISTEKSIIISQYIDNSAVLFCLLSTSNKSVIINSYNFDIYSEADSYFKKKFELISKRLIDYSDRVEKLNEQIKIYENIIQE